MKRHSPSAARNKGPIGDVLSLWLPPRGVVLEIASGSGEHAVEFAGRFPMLSWQPSDPDPAALASIAAWQAEAGLDNLRPPIQLDAAAAYWPVERAEALLAKDLPPDSDDLQKSVFYDACICINMIHISAWAATVGLFRGCAKILSTGAPLILYGPYVEDDVETALSNLAFDLSLKERNPEWGLRNLADVDQVATEYGFRRTRRLTMPANNLTLIYHKG